MQLAVFYTNRTRGVSWLWCMCQLICTLIQNSQSPKLSQFTPLSCQGHLRLEIARECRFRLPSSYIISPWHCAAIPLECRCQPVRLQQQTHLWSGWLYSNQESIYPSVIVKDIVRKSLQNDSLVILPGISTGIGSSSLILWVHSRH